MTIDEAAKVLEIASDIPPEQLEARFNDLRRRLEDKIAKAPTPGLQAKYRGTLAEITTAFETLTLAADASSLPVLQRVTSERSSAELPPASEKNNPELRAKAPHYAGDTPAPAKSTVKTRNNREFLIVALIALLLLGAGGWWVMKTRAENAERERVAAAAKVEADRQAEDARLAAEAQKKAGEEEKARIAAAEKAEKERQEKLLALTSARLADLRIAWEAVEQEVRKTERRLNELRGDERTLANAAKGAPGPDLLRLRGEIAAQASYHDWLESQVGRHEAKILRAQAEAMISVRQFDEAAKIAAQAVEAQAGLDRSIASIREQMLTLTGSLTVDVQPAQAAWVLTDSFGGKRNGQGSLEVTGVPWGPLELEITLAGYQPKRWAEVLRRSEKLALSHEFKPSTVRLDSSPAGAEIWIEGKQQGVTPATIEWPGDGELELTLRLRGHEPALRKLRLTAGSTTDAGSIPLRRITTGLTRPDFSKGPLRYAFSRQMTHNFQNTDNSRHTEDYVSNTASQTEQTVEIHSQTGLAEDAISVTTTTAKHIYNGKIVFNPGTIFEYTKGEAGWMRTLKAGGASDPNVQATMKDGLVASPIERRTLLDAEEWWPRDEKKAGDTWTVPIKAIAASGMVILPNENQSGTATGRLVSFLADENRQVAEVEFTFNVSAASTAGEIKMQYASTGRVNCTVDLRRNFISAVSYTVQSTQNSDAPIMLGMRLKSVTTTSASETTIIRPL